MDPAPVGTFVRMIRPRNLAAWLLLAAMMLVALPRTWFHHCEEGSAAHAWSTGGPAVHADQHCAACEAPAPVAMSAMADGPGVEWRLLGAGEGLPGTRIHAVHAWAPRMRGPPSAV